MEANILSDYFTEIEAANQLHLSKRTLKRYRAERVGPPAIRIGRQIFYRRKGILEWLLCQEQKRVK